MAVFDKDLNSLNTNDESLKALEEYIRYMKESVEFAMSKTAGKTEFNNLSNRVKALEDNYTALDARVKKLEGK